MSFDSLARNDQENTYDKNTELSSIEKKFSPVF